MKEIDVNERRIIAQTVNWCAANSLLYSDGNMNFTHAPVSLAPNTFSASEFDYAQTLQPIINEVFLFLDMNMQASNVFHWYVV